MKIKMLIVCLLLTVMSVASTASATIMTDVDNRYGATFIGTFPLSSTDLMDQSQDTFLSSVQDSGGEEFGDADTIDGLHPSGHFTRVA